MVIVMTLVFKARFGFMFCLPQSKLGSHDIKCLSAAVIIIVKIAHPREGKDHEQYSHDRSCAYDPGFVRICILFTVKHTGP